MHPIIHFENINVNAMETNSGIFVGTNSQFAWSSHNKSNVNISSISGDRNQIEMNVNVIYDNDLIDTPIDDKDFVLTVG